MGFDEKAYLVLALRYKELVGGGGGPGGGGDVPFEIEGHLTQIDTGRIDAEYMNSRFDKYLKLVNLDPKPAKADVDAALSELHKTFAALTQDEQKYANLFLRDIERGGVVIEPDKTLRDYITEYQAKAESDEIRRIADIFGMDEVKLRELVQLKPTDANINEYGRFDRLKETVDKAKARLCFEKQYGVALSPAKLSMEIDQTLRRFLIEGIFD
jgi:type I restriction enzyme R subunit